MRAKIQENIKTRPGDSEIGADSIVRMGGDVKAAPG
jgi:hypothetical protein